MSTKLDPIINQLLQEGTVIPAHPLAIHADRSIDEERQNLLTEYYLHSGAGGVAVGVHTTQFEIRKPEFNLYEKTLQLAAGTIEKSLSSKPFIKVAGIVGPTSQAVKEAEIAIEHGYHLGLLSMGGIPAYSESDLIDRTVEVSQIIPVFGFYLQPAVGGRLLTYDFWRQFAEIPNVYAIKIAPFNRYQTLDVVRAVCDSSRRDEIALYTGNDDNIVADLLTTYRFNQNGSVYTKRIVGGLLGHWAVWTKKAVDLLEEIKLCIANDYLNVEDLLSKGIEVTDMNAVIFDAKNSFHGCIPGIHEVLYRQGILRGTWCLNPDEVLSPGQADEIDRVCRAYPHLIDDDFVKGFIETRKVLTN